MAAARTPRAPSHLETRGRRLWREVTAESTLGPAALVLLEEACRLADRMDRMDRILRGDTDAWMKLTFGEGEIAVTVSSVVAEARQHAAAYRQILAELRQGAAKDSGAGKRTADTAGGTGGVADLSAKIAARREQSTG